MPLLSYIHAGKGALSLCISFRHLLIWLARQADNCNLGKRNICWRNRYAWDERKRKGVWSIRVRYNIGVVKNGSRLWMEAAQMMKKSFISPAYNGVNTICLLSIGYNCNNAFCASVLPTVSWKENVFRIYFITSETLQRKWF